MAKSELLPRLNSRFEDSVEKLASEGEALSKAYADVTKRILDFAKRFHDLWIRSQELDKGEEDGVHRKYLRDRLAEAIGTDNKSIRSRWISIGQHAPELSQLKEALPPARDSLYEVALAIEAKKPVAKWVDEGSINPQSTVRELRALRQPKAKAKIKSRPKRSRNQNAEVTLFFSTYDEAVTALIELIINNPSFELSSHKAFLEAIRSRIDANDYEKIAKRFR
jgi:hypothetical protein